MTTALASSHADTITNTKGETILAFRQHLFKKNKTKEDKKRNDDEASRNRQVQRRVETPSQKYIFKL